MNKKTLKKIIADHRHYLARDIEGWKNMRADLSNADLIHANLHDVDLRRADLRGANLCNADLGGAMLSGADLHGAILRDANLKWTDLREADLHFAILTNANLENACLEDANLRGAYMVNAILSSANLMGANLNCADLTFADLNDANLTCANLYNAQLDETEKFRKGVVLSESIIGYKKCLDNIIVELKIPKGAVVFSINGKKCRTNKCKVISISNGDKGISMYDNLFVYEVGKEIEIENFNVQYNTECGRGIHFFKSKEDAEKY